jgi:hypothetical protein
VTSSRFYLAPDACENGDLGIPQLTPSVSTPIPLQHPFPTTPVLLPKSIYESFCRVAEYRELFGKFIIKKDMLLGQVLFALVSVVELDSELI